MILVVTIKETDELTGKQELLASHGVDMKTGQMIVLQQVKPQLLGARFDAELQEFVLEGSRVERPRA